MPMSRAKIWALAQPQSNWTGTARLSRALRSAAPALLFGLRLWAAVCLALYIAFWLQLDNAYWAGTSAAIVCQPQLGASLRKGWFRMVGTVVGAVAIVVLTACFPQDRGAFLIGLALWSAGCALLATLLRNFAAYAAALAGYTAAIIASDQLGATGGVNGQAFTLAVTRASEICIGIVCAGIVLAATDFGGDRRPVCRHLVAGRAGAFGHAADTPRTDPARHRARPRHRPGGRGVRPDASPFADLAGGGGRAVRRPGRLASGGRSPDTSAA